MVKLRTEVTLRRRKFREMRNEFTDYRVAMRTIGKAIQKENRKNFILKGSGKYAPLSPEYAEQKARKVGNLPILVFSGRLRDSVTARMNGDSIFEVGRDSVTVGTKTPYAPFIQRGTRKMPARPFLFVTRAQERSFERIIQDFTDQKARQINGL